jgi:DNA replication ATP-dependent helicase Dna2
MSPDPLNPDSFAAVIDDLRLFLLREQAAAREQSRRIWERPLGDKLATGWTQGFSRIELCAEGGGLWAYLDQTESRFREGDLLLLHGGDALATPILRRLALELEEDDRWLLRAPPGAAPFVADLPAGTCFADPDALDLTPYFQRALDDVAASELGRTIILPLLAGAVQATFDPDEVDRGERAALAAGLDPRQAEAVGLAVGADTVACIQGPPGTGKTRVLAAIARALVQRGDRILVTSHTHTAINNALARIHGEGIPTVKVGAATQRRGLPWELLCLPSLAAWDERPESGGYVVGATPFATGSPRLEGFGFDTILFDEASQITVPLALMAMRAGRRFVFIGDQRQLPPVLLSRSVLAREPASVFDRLTAVGADHTVMLDRTYRMNRWLTAWPSGAFYDGQLEAAGVNRERRFSPPAFADARLAPVLDAEASAVFIPTLDRGCRARNQRDAELVCDLCAAVAGPTIGAGGALARVGVVSPFRAQGRAIRNLLRQRFGPAATAVVADTVERMQGQEREVVILSLAASDELFLAGLAEFLFLPERLNVSITRAMTKLIIIGPELKVGALAAVAHPGTRRGLDLYADLIARCRRVVL